MGLCRTIVVLILIAVVTSSCSMKPRVGAPWMQDLLNNGPENSSPKFKQGWQEGCETGISVTSNAFQRHFYKFKQDYKLAQDKEYYIAWKLAYDYCQRYVFQYLRRNMI